MSRLELTLRQAGTALLSAVSLIGLGFFTYVFWKCFKLGWDAAAYLVTKH